MIESVFKVSTEMHAVLLSLYRLLYCRYSNTAAFLLRFFPLLLLLLLETCRLSFFVYCVFIDRLLSWNFASFRFCIFIFADDEDEDVIEIPSSLMPPHRSDDAGNGKNPQAPDSRPLSEYVWVRALSRIADASSIRVEPLSDDDYALIESRADWLARRGGMLRQISVVWPNQVVPLRLFDDDDDSVDNKNGDGPVIARVRVLPDGFRRQGNTDGVIAAGIWPDDDDDKNRRDIQWEHCCMRLVADTRVVVIDPPEDEEGRQRRRTAGILGNNRGALLRVCPGLGDYDIPMRQLASRLDFHLVSLHSCCCAAIHPRTASVVFAVPENGDLSGTDHRLLAAIEPRMMAEYDGLGFFLLERDAATTATTTATTPTIVRVVVSASVPEGAIGKIECREEEVCAHVALR